MGNVSENAEKHEPAVKKPHFEESKRHDKYMICHKQLVARFWMLMFIRTHLVNSG
jgi:hypothetical protein